MKVAIITRGRVGRLHTLSMIPRTLLDNVYIVCPPEEVQLHKHLHPDISVLSEGADALNYSDKFNNIINGVYQELGRRILIMDDDLSASMREGASLVKATEEAKLAGFAALKLMMEDYPLVGLHPRAMGNHAPDGIKECTRINAIQGVNLDLIGPLKTNYWPILADMVLNLSLLTRGQKTAIWCQLFWDQKGTSNAPGGCSLHRTPQQQKEAVLGLAELFPDVVTVKEKVVKNGWFGPNTPRTDFVVFWRKTKAARL